MGQCVVTALDGKTLRGTITNQEPVGVHLLAAYLPGEGLVLMQMVVEKDIENEIAMADAMHAQRNLSAQIVAADGDYVWIVKDD